MATMAVDAQKNFEVVTELLSKLCTLDDIRNKLELIETARIKTKDRKMITPGQWLIKRDAKARSLFYRDVMKSDQVNDAENLSECRRNMIQLKNTLLDECHKKNKTFVDFKNKVRIPWQIMLEATTAQYNTYLTDEQKQRYMEDAERILSKKYETPNMDAAEVANANHPVPAPPDHNTNGSSKNEVRKRAKRTLTE
jgi:hypothetical protein